MSDDSVDITKMYAHTPNKSGVWHRLDEHLSNVADIAEGFGRRFGFEEISRQAGLLHDIGKYNPDFQRYLKECVEAKNGSNQRPRKAPHSIYGAMYTANKANPLLAIILAGHHGGLSNLSNLKVRLANPEINEQESLAKILDNIQPQEFTPIYPKWAATPLSSELLIRMLFSNLVDADWLDTEAHFDPGRGANRGRYFLLEDLWQSFQADQSRLMTGGIPDSIVNQARIEIYNACLDAAEGPQGVYRLTVPTGGGKTRSGMAFGLKHAIKHNLDRVIAAIPYTSIIDQTAAVYKNIFGADNVLEHHSSIRLPAVLDEEETELELRRQLASENWDAPIIVTTTVQLFESLFSNKPSKCRKLHNIANSVLILDEVQTLPMHLLKPILDILQELVKHYGVTLVLSTATQPAFAGESPYLKGFNPEPSEIITSPSRYFQMLKRVDYDIQSAPWFWERVAGEMHDNSQVLCIVNSRRDAVELFNLLDDPDAFHLSTLMCPAHRRQVLDEIRSRLQTGKPCRVVSTQLIEAGVDVDFPLVLRAVGPLDRIVQAAGRCNREGLRTTAGRVVIFNPAVERAPKGAYATSMAEAKTVLSSDECDLHDPDIFDRYFRRLWMDLELDAKKIQDLRNRLNYADVSDKFKLIDENTESVVVRYGDFNIPDRIINQARNTGQIGRDDWRILQSYSVSIFYYQFIIYKNGGLIEEITDGLYVWKGGYDKKTGILDEVLDTVDLIS